MVHIVKKHPGGPWLPPSGATVRGKTDSGREFAIDLHLIPRVRGARQNSMVTGVLGTDSTVNFDTLDLRPDSTVYFVNCPTVRGKSV